MSARFLFFFGWVGGGGDNALIWQANRKKSTYRTRSTPYHYINLKHTQTHKHTHMHTHRHTDFDTDTKLGQQSPAKGTCQFWADAPTYSTVWNSGVANSIPVQSRSFSSAYHLITVFLISRISPGPWCTVCNSTQHPQHTRTPTPLYEVQGQLDVKQCWLGPVHLSTKIGACHGCRQRSCSEDRRRW